MVPAFLNDSEASRDMRAAGLVGAKRELCVGRQLRLWL